MAIITENLFDLAGVSTTKPVQFEVQAPRASGAGDGVVMPRTITVHPVAGVITTEDLDPGNAVVRLDGIPFPIEIGAVGVEQRLWTLILAGMVTPPASTTWQSVVDAKIAELAGTYVRSVNGVPVDPVTGDVEVDGALPAGGAAGQVLTKTAGGAGWQEAPSSGVRSLADVVDAITYFNYATSSYPPRPTVAVVAFVGPTPPLASSKGDLYLKVA